MAQSISTASRIRGSILALAVTDALGAPAEFSKRNTFPHIDRYIPNRNFGTAPGTWTDDTSMTLCLAEALIEGKKSFVPQTAIRKWIAWHHKGYLSATSWCFDIGNATKHALGIWAAYFSQNRVDSADAAGHEEGQVAINRFLNRETGCGNGALMRTAPIPLLYHRFPELMKTAIVQAAISTHPYPLNAACCQVYCAMIAACFSGASKSDLVQVLRKELSEVDEENAKLKLRMSKYDTLAVWQRTEADDISSSGYVLNTLEAALWAFFTTETLGEGSIKVVNLGDDADTVGAVYGGLAGAFYGVEAIPSDWLEDLVKQDVVMKIADQLAAVENDLT